MAKVCNECSYPLNGNEDKCPECGNTLKKKVSTQPINSSIYIPSNYQTVSELFWTCQFYKVFKGSHFDLGQRIYEIFEMWWEYVKVWWHCFTKKFLQFEGRASRREYFSFVGLGGLLLNPFFVISLYLVVGFIPWLAISVRRMHDINKSGW